MGPWILFLPGIVFALILAITRTPTARSQIKGQIRVNGCAEK